MKRLNLLLFALFLSGIATCSSSAQAAEQVKVIIKSHNQLTLADAIQKQYWGDAEQITHLEVHDGELNAADCGFIRQSMPQLESLIVTGKANFAEGVIPKGAFAGCTSLRYVRVDRATKIGSKAFSLCEGLEEIDFPAVKAVEVQAFAQAKGSSQSRLRIARMTALEEMAPRTFYYCTSLKELYLNQPPKAIRPEGKEGLWFERVTEMVIHIPSRKVYDEFMKPEHSVNIDWSAFNFTADNGDELPKIEAAAAYDDKAYDHLREGYLPTFDRTDKDFSGEYYTGDFKLSLNLYTFNMNLNAWVNNSQAAPQLSTLDAIRWAAANGFDAVDITSYYIPGYSNTDMPTRPEAEILAYARQIKELCSELGIEISGTGLQNNFADPNQARRKTDVERIKFWIKVAAEMGAPVIRIFAGPPPADIRREGWEKIARERMVPHIQEVASFAKTHYPEVRIGLQNHGGMLATANQVMQVLKWIDCDNVGIINDTGFYRDFLSIDARQYDWYRDIAYVLPYSNNFQIKKKPAGAETSELMDLERIMRDIRKSPYRGYLPIELLWISKDEGYPGKMSEPPYEETLHFLERLKEAIEKTKEKPLAMTTRSTTPGASGSVWKLQEHTTLSDLRTNPMTAGATQLRVTSPDGLVREEFEPIQHGDQILITQGATTTQHQAEIYHNSWHNLAQITQASRIKKSSFSGKTPITNAFNGEAVGTSGSGYTVDRSQADTPDKSQFWLAADLGQSQQIDAFGVAWGTAVGQLKRRLKGGIYRVAYTNDPAKWEALSDAKQSGAQGLNNYAAPQGWEEAYYQDVNELPDANGNKFFFKPLSKPIAARYVMVTGELAAQSIEIYNFFAYQQQQVVGAKPTPEVACYDWIVARPIHPTMTLAPGRPAVITQGEVVPDFAVVAKRPLQLSATLVAPNNKHIYELPATSLAAGETLRIAPQKRAEQAGTYTLQLTLQGDEKLVDAYYFTAIDSPTDRYTAANPYPAIREDRNTLYYTPDYRGNRLIDYSHAGYKGGGVALETPAIKITLQPSEDQQADDAERIQRAINLIGRAPLNAQGFRGTLLLKAGTYRIGSPIYIPYSGIIIRGEGDGAESIKTHEKPLSPDNWFDYKQSEAAEKGITKVVATWRSDSYNKQTAMFNFGGERATEVGEAIAITNHYLPAGARRLYLANVSQLKSGDVIRIKRAVNGAWARDLAMDRITDAPGLLSENQWATNGVLERAYQDVAQERTIASVNYHEGYIDLVEPIVDPLNRRYGTSTVVKLQHTQRATQVGIEQIQLISRFNSKERGSNEAFGQSYMYYTDEQHAQVGVRFINSEDTWVRRMTTYHLDIAVAIGSEVRRTTIQDVNCLEPVSGTGGERRYSFTNAGGQQVLTQRCYTRYTRHGFIVMGHVMGPNVFLHCQSIFQFDANEPHLRWSAGGLFDNVTGRIYLQNRWNNGTAHGWSGANYTRYNCEGKFIISQNQLAANYLLGNYNEEDRLPFVMEEVDPGNVPNFRAHESPASEGLQAPSLYLRQLEERLGSKAVAACLKQEIPAVEDHSNGFIKQFAMLDQISVDGEPLAAFDPEVFEYTIPVALNASENPNIVAHAKSGYKIERQCTHKSTTLTASKKGAIPTTYVFNFHHVSKEPISASEGSTRLKNLTDGDPATSWSGSGSPYVQFYLGDEPVEIASVSLGYCRNTQSRRQYYFDFEISNDGYTWTKISHPEWQKDNLGRGHVMGMQLMPGVGNARTDYETFRFPKGVQARLLRVQMHGARFGRGSGTTNANSYWAIEVERK
ncbi:MAG: TIM barrel protein [Alistipes sp.]|nr:TIM barrel protein [Alistipes sp.]